MLWQKWHDLLFAHWPLPAETLRPLIPAPLILDTFEGQAWIGVVPFRMTGIRPRYMPPLPWLSAFPELNVRTYVTRDNKPGVFFMSLDATNVIANRLARKFFCLPYKDAAMQLVFKDGWIHYSSERTDKDQTRARFEGRYQPTGDVYRSIPGTLDHWLTERYCMYPVDPQGRVYRGNIHHPPWPLQPARAEIAVNTMTEPLGIRLPDTAPLLHFSREIHMVGWWLECLST
jgi:uncharacterized protein YqjF (DUF2071 family)